MESFHTTYKLCFTMLGLGMMASAHATTISCDQEFKTDGEIVVVENSIVCNTTTSPNDYAILISGNNIKFDLNGNWGINFDGLSAEFGIPGLCV